VSSARETTLFAWQRDPAAAALVNKARWPHALLIEGRRGIGKRALALHFAQALLCETPRSDGGPCGTCASCGYVRAGAHPDLRVIEPIERDEEGNEIPVDEILVDRIRELIEFTQLSTHRQRAKVAVIVPAEAMNVAAANALLKTLEEPPPTTYLMLVSHQPGRLRATIVSRCQRFVAPEPDPAAASAWLAEHGAAEPGLLLDQAGGAPLLALALSDPAVQRERAFLLTCLEDPQRLSPIELGVRIDGYRKEERKVVLADLVYWLLTWSADLAASASGGAPRYHPDRRELLGHPLVPRLVAEALLFEYRALFNDAHGS
jgi:DNA polymerase-3 subunit delta'